MAKGHRNPLGTPHEFENVYLESAGKERRRRQWRLRPSKAETFRQILRQYIVQMRRGDAKLQFPSREVRLMRVELSPEERNLTRLVASNIVGLSGLQQASLAQALMSSPQALGAQLENMGMGAAAVLARAVTEPAKLKRLLLLCDELRRQRQDNWRVVVFTHRKETQAVIGRRWKGGTSQSGSFEAARPTRTRMPLSNSGPARRGYMLWSRRTRGPRGSTSRRQTSW